MNYNGIVTYQNYDARIFTETTDTAKDVEINHLAATYVAAVEADFARAGLNAVLHTGGSGAVWWETPSGEQLQWPEECPTFWEWWNNAIANGLKAED